MLSSFRQRGTKSRDQHCSTVTPFYGSWMGCTPKNLGKSSYKSRINTHWSKKAMPKKTSILIQLPGCSPSLRANGTQPGAPSSQAAFGTKAFSFLALGRTSPGGKWRKRRWKNWVSCLVLVFWWGWAEWVVFWCFLGQRGQKDFLLDPLEALVWTSFWLLWRYALAVTIVCSRFFNSNSKLKEKLFPPLIYIQKHLFNLHFLTISTLPHHSPLPPC